MAITGAGDLGNLYVTLTANSAQFVRGMERARISSASTAKAIAAHVSAFKLAFGESDLDRAAIDALGWPVATETIALFEVGSGCIV